MIIISKPVMIPIAIERVAPRTGICLRTGYYGDPAKFQKSSTRDWGHYALFGRFRHAYSFRIVMKERRQ